MGVQSCLAAVLMQLGTQAYGAAILAAPSALHLHPPVITLAPSLATPTIRCCCRSTERLAASFRHACTMSPTVAALGASVTWEQGREIGC